MPDISTGGAQPREPSPEAHRGRVPVGTRLANVTGDGDVLSALGLNIRSYNALVNSGISTVRDLLAKTQVEIATLPGHRPSVLIHLEWH